jgi:hypothetical protein
MATVPKDPIQAMRNRVTWTLALVAGIYLLAGAVPLVVFASDVITAEISIALGLAILLLCFWSRQKPFEASLIATAIFILRQVVELALSPQSLLDGFMLRITQLVLLLLALHAAWKLNSLQPPQPVEAPQAPQQP